MLAGNNLISFLNAISEENSTLVNLNVCLLFTNNFTYLFTFIFPGLVALGIGFFTTILWTAVWIVAAEAADKPQVLLNRNPLGFQRL